jgi:hypothetical protein
MDAKMTDSTQEGSIALWLEHDDIAWLTNADPYNFGPFNLGSGLWLSAAKQKHSVLELQFDGAFGQRFAWSTHVLRSKAPSGRSGVHVVLTWKDGTVSLSLNGKPVEAVATRQDDL